ncbi:S-adenosyl-L-methionine-dependent methyltransferase [Pseudoneurospora amorphoporcata]|uniref:S-adenosyl-L-methionine-dependent methyltransferase n=1 Tax=Pseudoneurospora amorphoporcata TaxID=241081 RepID=A0AAN6P5T0_9PEZI|nr:S-adenosyl-L-methionine-dependent methyltransferase [Pseudoneurospora amorphoporcata]
MSRVKPQLFWQGRKKLGLNAAKLLPVCRTLESTANELRWIKQHVAETPSIIPFGARVWKLCDKRGKGLPLAYVLGNQPFGDLEIKCQPGVLIPRTETESYTIHLSNILRRSAVSSSKSDPADQQPLNIIDLCTGTGCIPLLLYSQLSRSLPFQSLNVVGVDISQKAINLSRQNLHHNLGAHRFPAPSDKSKSHPLQRSLHFLKADIFSSSAVDPILSTPVCSEQCAAQEAEEQQQQQQPTWDLLTSNPPYISPSGFLVSTSRSVRNWEPKLALVPPVERVDLHQKHFYHHYYPDDENLLPTQKGNVEYEEEDVFFARLLEIARTYRPKRVLMEVGDMEQAKRVVGMVLGDGKLRKLYFGEGTEEEKGGTVQIWRDDLVGFEGYEEIMDIGKEKIVVKGHPEGHGRSVYLRRVGVVDA